MIPVYPTEHTVEDPKQSVRTLGVMDDAAG